MSFDDYIKRIRAEDEELLKSLGSDYDEEGLPYWEKWGIEAHLHIDKQSPIGIE